MQIPLLRNSETKKKDLTTYIPLWYIYHVTPMKEADMRRCKQCGVVIHPMSTRSSDRQAYERGFCGAECAEVHDALLEIEKHEAEKDMSR